MPSSGSLNCDSSDDNSDVEPETKGDSTNEEQPPPPLSAAVVDGVEPPPFDAAVEMPHVTTEKPLEENDEMEKIRCPVHAGVINDRWNNIPSLHPN